MTKLLPITVISLILSAISHNRTSYNLDEGKINIKHENFFWFFMAVLMVFFVGLRTAYNDTFAYIYSYNNHINANFNFNQIEWKIGSNPGYLFIRILIKSLGFSVNSQFLLFSALTIIPYCWFIRKYSTNFLFSIFLLFTMGVFTLTLAAMKQCVSIAFALIGIDREIQGKHIRFLFWIVLSSLFHPYTILFFAVPFLMYEPWRGKTWLLLLITAFVGLSLNFLLGNIISVTAMMGEDLTEDSLSGEGVNFIRVLVIWSPLVLSFHCRQKIWEEKNKICNLFLNLSLVNGTIMFVALFGTANYFARLAHYFLIFQVLTLPWIISLLPNNEKKIIFPVSVAGYSAYFLYANIVNQNFDSLFRSMSFLDYIKSLIK